jgi:CSLREA domain-containing protein
MRTRIALAATIATAAAAGALAPAGMAATPSGAEHFPACSPDCDIVVNSTADLPDANPGNGKCATATGKCTLRAAVQEANAAGSRPPFQSTIKVPPGTYVLTRHGLDDNAARGDLDLHFFGQVIGAGQSRTVIDGDHADRVFDLWESDERVAHLAVRNGRATDGPGGGIRVPAFNSYGTYLDYLYVTDNEAVPTEAPRSGLGGGIDTGDTGLYNTVVAYNDAQDGGGVGWHGIQLFAAFASVIYNHATRDGGGVLFGGGDAGLGQITISGNRADGHGGGLFVPGGGKTLVGATVASNSAPTGNGGGIWLEGEDQEGPTRGIEGTIVARNGGGDCGGPGHFFSRGANLDGDGSCSLTAETDIAEVDPLLGPVGYHGGPTQTRVLEQGSPAIGLWAGCSRQIDQRGATRPQGPNCDAGAYEVGACCPASEPPYEPGPAPPPGPHSPCGLIEKGTLGPDVILGDSGRNDLRGLAGDDRMFGRSNADCLYGGTGNDFMKGGQGHDALYGRSGNDELSGGDDEDILLGETGHDRLYGGADDDRLYGGSEGDYIKGGDGYDTISAGPGNDVIDATGKGLDAVDCGSGNDRVKAKRLEHLYGCEHVKFVD